MTASRIRFDFPSVPLPAVLLVLAVASTAMAQKPQALRPLPTPSFSIDAASPSSMGLAAADILVKPGPSVSAAGAGLGLPDALDDLNALSFNRRQAVDSAPEFLVLFGVGRGSQGLALPPDPVLEASGRIFTVNHQFQRSQQPADLYIGLDAFTRTGRSGLRGPPTGNNTMGMNQGDTGGVDKDLEPETNPLSSEPGGEKDNSNAGGYSSGGSPRGADTGAVFFCASAGSPSLLTLPGNPGQQSGADVYVDFDKTTGGNEFLYVSATELGLLPTPQGDDIDALIVLDNGNSIFEPGIDQVIFSLASGSPSLGSQTTGAADLYTSTGFGLFTFFASAGDFGLRDTDDIDILEVIPTADPSTTLFERAIFVAYPGDVDGDNLLTPIDCGGFEIAYSGPGVSFDSDGHAIIDVDVGPGLVFDPPDVIVETGDTVRWTWLGGLHNVVSGQGGVPDGVFSSGPPVSTIGTIFEVTFDSDLLNEFPMPDSFYPYYCSVHEPLGMVGSVTVEPHPSATFDLDFDGDTDCEDWFEFQAVYADANDGDLCTLSVPDFILALLDQPQVPAHECMADMNGDGRRDGLDIDPYVDAFLTP